MTSAASLLNSQCVMSRSVVTHSRDRSLALTLAHITPVPSSAPATAAGSASAGASSGAPDPSSPSAASWTCPSASSASRGPRASWPLLLSGTRGAPHEVLAVDLDGAARLELEMPDHRLLPGHLQLAPARLAEPHALRGRLHRGEGLLQPGPDHGPDVRVEARVARRLLALAVRPGGRAAVREHHAVGLVGLPARLEGLPPGAAEDQGAVGEPLDQHGNHPISD